MASPPHSTQPTLNVTSVREMLLDRHTGIVELARVEGGERRIDFLRAFGDVLPGTADARHALDSHRPFAKERGSCAARIGGRKRRVAAQHRIARPTREGVRPAFGRNRVAPDQGMRDRLGRDERVRHHAAEEILRATDAESSCLRRQQRVVRHEVERMRMGETGVVLAAERPAHHLAPGGARR